MQTLTQENKQRERSEFKALVLAQFCAVFGVAKSQQDAVLESGLLCVDGVNVVVRDVGNDGAVELFAELGTPAPSDRLEVYRQLLQINFLDETPGLIYGLNPRNDKVFAMCTLHGGPLEENPNVAALLMAMAVDKIKGLRTQFSFETISD